MPDPEVREAWGRYAEAFAAEGSAAEERESIRTLVTMVDPAPGSLVLDVATGAGYTAFVFARTGARVVALDPTFEMLQATRTGWAERSLAGRPAIVEAWAEALPFADATFDAVVAHRAPHQFSDQEAFAREAHRVLREGGVLGIADQSPPDGFEEWHNDLERLRDPTHEHARSPGTWRRIVEGVGLRWEGHAVVFQHHDVEDWMDRVDCPAPNRDLVRARLLAVPDEIGDTYRPGTVDGRLVMRTPQTVLVARR